MGSMVRAKGSDISTIRGSRVEAGGLPRGGTRITRSRGSTAAGEPCIRPTVREKVAIMKAVVGSTEGAPLLLALESTGAGALPLPRGRGATQASSSTTLR